MKKKIGFLLSTCMSVTALPLFAAACKNEQPNHGKQDEIDLNSLFKISLSQNTQKKPSELKPEDIVVKILHKDIKVEIQKVEFKEGKGVLVSYLATNSKTNKIVDEKTITLEVAIKKDDEPKSEKNYDNLITISVNENAKQKTADKLTKEDIKLEIAKGESFKAEVISVNLQENSKTVIDVKIKITDNETTKELTKTLEVVVEKDEAKPKKNKKYDDLVTISVAEETKKKSADEVTKEEIKISIKDGETFEARVESVSVPKKQLDTVNVKIKIVDGDTTKHISKKIGGFVQAYPKEVKDGYTKFKDLKIVDEPKAHEWLNQNKDGTVIYYDRESGQFFISKPKKDNDNLAIFQVESKPKNTIETAAPKGAISGGVNEESYKATALLIKEGEKVGIKFRISQYNHNTKKPIFYEKVETSDLLEIDKEKIAKSIQPDSGKSGIQGDQPSAGGDGSGSGETGNVTTENPKNIQPSEGGADSTGSENGNGATETPQGDQPPAENDGSSEDKTNDQSGEAGKKENPEEKVDSGKDGSEMHNKEPSASDVETSDGGINKDTDVKDRTNNGPSSNQDSPEPEKDKKEVMDSGATETTNNDNTAGTNPNNSEQPSNNEKPNVEAPADPNPSVSSPNTDTTADSGNIKRDEISEKSKEFSLPELYVVSEKGTLFVIEDSADKNQIRQLLLDDKSGRIRIEDGKLKVKKASKDVVVQGISIINSVSEDTKIKVNTHSRGGRLVTIGYTYSRGSGINVKEGENKKIIFSWYLYNNDNQPVEDKIYTQTIDFS